MAMSGPEDSERKPRLQEVIGRALEAFGRRLPKAMPARVTKYEATKQRVSCKVLVQSPYFDEEDVRQVESIPVVPGVPVVFPGAGGFRLTCPISDGNLQIDGQTVPATTGLLVWCDRSLDSWLTGRGPEVDPQIDHWHSLTDAVFLPGLNPFGAALNSCPTDHMTVGADAGVQIHFHSQTIVAGDEAGAQFVALANLVKARLDAIQVAHDTHKHATAAIGAPSIPDTIIGTLAAVAATQFKAT